MSAALDKAAAMAAEAAARGLPPVHLWNPSNYGDIDIVITRDGRWIHEGRPIERESLVRLFSTILRRDPDGFYLVTPVEKLRLRVEDAPFVAVRVDSIGEALRFVTNVGDTVEAGGDHRLRVETDSATGEPAPYVHVRADLEARLSRPVFYELAAMAQEQDGELWVSSNGVRFSLGRSA